MNKKTKDSPLKAFQGRSPPFTKGSEIFFFFATKSSIKENQTFNLSPIDFLWYLLKVKPYNYIRETIRFNPRKTYKTWVKVVKIN